MSREDETTVNESYLVTVSAAVQQAAGVEAGDKLRWTVDEERTLSVAVLKQGPDAFSELEPIDIDEPTDAAEDHDFIAGEY